MNLAFLMSLSCLIYVANLPFEANLPIAGFGQLGLRNLRALARFRQGRDPDLIPGGFRTGSRP